MSEPFLSEIRIFGFNFAPRGWALCDGQILPINQNQSLYSLLGTNYGGDGRTTFALPDLRGRTPIHRDDGHPLAQKSGAETVSLTAAEIAAHTHTVKASSSPGNAFQTTGNVFAEADAYRDPEAGNTTALRSGTVTNADALGNGDLDVVHIVAVPQRLKDGVGKAKGQNVLDGLLAQIVVNTADLALFKDGMDLLIESLGALSVVPKGLFDDDAPPTCTVAIQPGLAQLLDNGGIQRRRSG